MGLRLTEAELDKLTRKHMPMGALLPSSTPRPAPARSNRDIVASAAKSFRQSVISGNYSPGTSLFVEWDGAELIDHNRLLRMDYRLYTSYRHACHTAVENAALLLVGAQRQAFHGKVVVSYYWQGRSKPDEDGLIGSAKFILDGVKRSRLLIDDGETYIAGFRCSRLIGPPKFGVTLEAVTL